jgi:hypothetical protein
MVAPALAPDGFQEPKNFRTVRAAHYAIQTNINDDALTAELARRMDVMYDQYCLALSPFRPPADQPPLPTYLFAKRSTYMAATNNVAANTGGFFRGGDRPILVSYLDDNGRDGLRRTLQHEAFHGFAWFAIAHDLPIWLNEGMAQLFEEGIWTGRKFLLGQVPPRRIRQLQADIRGHKLVSFDRFFRITPEEWSRNLHTDALAGATYYGEAWAIAYFLQYGPSGRFHTQYLEALTALHADPDGDGPHIFGAHEADTAGLQRAFESWATRLQPTPEATLLERLDTLGDFLAGMHKSEPRIARSMTQFRNELVGYGVSMRYHVGAVTYETVKPASIYFCDLDGHTYGDRQLYFDRVKAAPLPDIVCRPNGAFTLRTHFYDGPKEIEHESAIAPAQ